MTCQQLRFLHGECLVEVDTRNAAQGRREYSAFVSLLEDGGAIVRPLVQLNGRRIEIRASSEPLTMNSAISYLQRRFGAISQPRRGCALATSSFGPPVVVAD